MSLDSLWARDRDALGDDERVELVEPVSDSTRLDENCEFLRGLVDVLGEVQPQVGAGWAEVFGCVFGSHTAPLGSGDCFREVAEPAAVCLFGLGRRGRWGEGAPTPRAASADGGSPPASGYGCIPRSMGWRALPEPRVDE